MNEKVGCLIMATFWINGEIIIKGIGQIRLICTFSEELYAYGYYFELLS